VGGALLLLRFFGESLGKKLCKNELEIFYEYSTDILRKFLSV
jgi:hypothetical protein